MPYHYTTTGTESAAISTVNATGRVAPEGFHYMPDGTLMSDISHAELYGSYVITDFDINTSDLPTTSEKRYFTINGTEGASFILEIKDKDTGKYYNFVTNAFQTSVYQLKKRIGRNAYTNSIVFPAVTGDDDQYNIYLYAVPGTSHAQYSEIRFADGSVDINSSRGSDSLMLQKVIYQQANLTLTIGKASPNSTIEMTGSGHSTSTVTIPRGKKVKPTAFSVKSVVTTATKAYRILKQPTTGEMFSRSSVTVGSEPQVLPGENIYPTVTGTDTVNGDFSGGATAITMDSAVASKMALGDRVTGTDALNAGTFTVASIDSTNVFSLSASAAIEDGTTLSFSNQKNYRWPLDDIKSLSLGSVVQPGTNVTANTVTAEYEYSTTLNEDTEEEEKIIHYKAEFKDTQGKKATVTKGVVTTQPGSVIFDKQQVKALAGDTITIGGYGEAGIKDAIGYTVRITELEMTLTPITTTVVNDTVNSSTVTVASRAGILNGDTVSGIGISDSQTQVNSGDIVLSNSNSLTAGTTLTFGKSSTAVTITGKIEVLKAGTRDEVIFFDMEKLVSITA